MYPRSNLKLNTWKADCDRCGFSYHADQLKKTWDNLYVCKECWEPRHPMDFLKGIPDNQDVPWVRKDPTDFSTTTVGDADKTLTIGTDSQTQIWNTALTAGRTATLSNSGAIANDSFVVYRTGVDAFSLTVTFSTGNTILTVPSMATFIFDGTSWREFSYTTL